MNAVETMEALDPRVRRTRGLLQEALSGLLREKDFERISIGEIAERATLSRATFYDHYADKDALLECMVARRFREVVAARGISFTGCEGAIRGLALGVCVCLVEMEPALRESEKPLEAAMVTVLRGMMLEGLRLHPPAEWVPEGLVASTMAWAIYGAAREWVRMPDRMPMEEAAGVIDRLLSPVMLGVSS